MTYDEALSFIHSVLKFGSKLGLTNISELLRRLGDPQDKIRTIHVAGTNGKGSTSAMIAKILECQGYKTGLFTSPYIEDFRERIQINSEMISKEKLAELTGVVKQVCDDMVKDGFNHPTEFEVVTAIGFLYFANCDYAVIEVGLGGRLDATNVLKSPLVSVITLIDYDHTEYLGGTLAEIAYEKCGIVKPGVPVVTYGYQDDEALKVIEDSSKSNGSELYVAQRENRYNGIPIFPVMKGDHQKKNMQTVLETIRVLKKLGVEISDTSVINGIEGTQFIGRFEYIDSNLVIDGAHNSSGMKTFCDAVKELEYDRLIVVCGMLEDKSYCECAELIKDIADVIIATEPDSPRKLSAFKFADVLGTDLCFENPIDAVNYAKAIADDEDLIAVCGSLYLIGGIRLNFNVLK